MYKVSEQDKKLVNQWKWYTHHSGYIVGWVKVNGKWKNVSLHRFLLNPPRNKDIDHINGDKTDNRRENLRVVLTSQNCMNQKKGSGFSSIYKGVSKRRNKWFAQIVHNYKHHYLGTFPTEISAAMAYDIAAKDLFGKFALLNF